MLKRHALKVCLLAERVGFEPTEACTSTDFEGVETAILSYFRFISFYTLLPKLRVKWGFSYFRLKAFYNCLQGAFRKLGTIRAPRAPELKVIADNTQKSNKNHKME